jgi:hypothetical protein
VINIKEQEKASEVNVEIKLDQEKGLSGTQEGQFKEMLQFDLMIRSLEAEEKKIEEEKRKVEKCMAEYASVSAITPSGAVNQLESVDKCIQKIIFKSERMTDQSIRSRIQELNMYIESLKKPEEVQDEFFAQLSVSMRSKFV